MMTGFPKALGDVPSEPTMAVEPGDLGFGDKMGRFSQIKIKDAHTSWELI